MSKGKKNPIFDVALPTVLSIANPALGAAYAGAKTTVETGNPLQGLKSAGLSYVGNKLGSSIGGSIGGKLGTVGEALGTSSNAIGSTLGSAGVGAAASNAIGSLANQSLGSMLGGYAGNSIAKDMMPQASQKIQAPAPFKAAQQDQQEIPGSLSGLSAFSPEQQSSNIATQGVYGGGVGPQEQSYFTNLINRRLVDQGGKVGDLSQLSPVESSYLSQLGLGGYGSSNDLLKALTQWKPA